jgi:uncharacterized protein (TIGR02996 family)
LLERAERDPDDNALRVVLADALSEAGDPRGELAAVQRQHDALVTLSGALWETYPALYGPRIDELALTHESGFIDTLTLQLGDGQYERPETARHILARVLPLRVARLVHRVRLDIFDVSAETLVPDVTASLALLAQHAPVLRDLELRLYTSEDVANIDLGPALDKLALEKLAIYASNRTLQYLCAGTWPAITKLVIGTLSTDDEIEVTSVRRLLDGKAFPNLVDLTPELPPKVLAELYASPIARRLKILRCAFIEDPHAKALLANRANLVALEELVTQACYTPALRRELLARFPEVRGLDREAAE